MRIEHVALYVKDLENTKKFFMKYLGAKSNDGYHNQKTGFCSYFLTFEDGARIEIMNIPEMDDSPKKLARTGYSHIAQRGKHRKSGCIDSRIESGWL